MYSEWDYADVVGGYRDVWKSFWWRKFSFDSYMGGPIMCDDKNILWKSWTYLHCPALEYGYHRKDKFQSTTGPQGLQQDYVTCEKVWLPWL